MKLFNQTKYKDFRKELRNNATIDEKILWDKLKGSKFLDLKFRGQYSVDKFILDFYCPKLKFGIAVDGSSHNQVDSEEKDERRTKYLESEGIKIIRFKDYEIIENVDKVLIDLKTSIENLKQVTH